MRAGASYGKARSLTNDLGQVGGGWRLAGRGRNQRGNDHRAMGGRQGVDVARSAVHELGRALDRGATDLTGLAAAQPNSQHTASNEYCSALVTQTLLSRYPAQSMTEAGPSIAVQLTGLNSVPAAGEEFEVCASDSAARSAAAEFEEKLKVGLEVEICYREHVNLSCMCFWEHLG